MSSRKSQPKPWPMRWVVVAILISIASYTYLTLHYRKPGPEFKPYEDLGRRATIARLVEAGWQRIPVASRRPADPINPGQQPTHPAAIDAGLPGLPAELSQAFIEKPQLAAAIAHVVAPAEATKGSDYTVYFTCTLVDQKHQIFDVELYVKGRNAILIPVFEKFSGALLARNNETAVWLDVPTQALKPGQYRVTLTGATSSKAWDLVVR